jgi:hypothetical protein
MLCLRPDLIFAVGIKDYTERWIAPFLYTYIGWITEKYP